MQVKLIKISKEINYKKDIAVSLWFEHNKGSDTFYLNITNEDYKNFGLELGKSYNLKFAKINKEEIDE